MSGVTNGRASFISLTFCLTTQIYIYIYIEQANQFCIKIYAAEEHCLWRNSRLRFVLVEIDFTRVYKGCLLKKWRVYRKEGEEDDPRFF